MKKFDDLYISNMNEAAMAIDEDVNVEMQRLCTEATLELCYVPLYRIDPQKNKIAFNDARSLHFKDVEFEPNVSAADVIGFAETRFYRSVRVSVIFHFMFVHYTFSSVWVAEWPPFGK